MANIQSTIAFLESHGVNHASETPDGILAMSWVRHSDNRGDDEWLEEAAIFPIVGGNVSLHDVKEWLGY